MIKMITEKEFIRCINNAKLNTDNSELLHNILLSADEESRTFNLNTDNGVNLTPLETIALRIRDGNKKKTSMLFPEIEVTHNKDDTITIEGKLTDWLQDVIGAVKEIPPGIYAEGRNSIYTADMYMLLKPYLSSNRKIGALRIEIGIDELREILGTQDKYERLSQLKDKVLKPSLFVLSNAYKTNIDYTCVSGGGRTVKSVVFSISDIKPIKIGGKRNE